MLDEAGHNVGAPALSSTDADDTQVAEDDVLDSIAEKFRANSGVFDIDSSPEKDGKKGAARPAMAWDPRQLEGFM